MTLTHVGKLRMNMTIEETLSVTNIAPKNKYFLENISTEDKIEVHSYILSSGDYGSTYFLVFKNNTLFFWGYPHEFARKEDPFINEIGQKAIIKLKEQELIY